MSAVFEYAVATLRADSDLVWPVRRALPANKTQHKTALTTAQIGKLLNDFDIHPCGLLGHHACPIRLPASRKTVSKTLDIAQGNVLALINFFSAAYR